MNIHMLSGTVDTEVQRFQAGDKQKYTFRLAEVGGKGWHNIVIWSDDGVTIPKQGDLIYVEGRKQDRSYEVEGAKRYITETIARVCRPLDGSAAQSAPATESDLFDE